MNTHYFHTGVVGGLLLACWLSIAPVQVQARTQDEQGVRFVTMLIERGIIAPALAEKAQTLAHLFLRTDEVSENPMEPQMLNADKVRVHVSQRIEFSKLTFAEGAEIEGLLLLVTNEAGNGITLEAKQGCQVLYRIYDTDDALLYDSAASERCATDRRVTYVLKAGATRMFEVKHKVTDHALTPGTYRVELEYPGYGKGERNVTVRSVLE